MAIQRYSNSIKGINHNFFLEKWNEYKMRDKTVELCARVTNTRYMGPSLKITVAEASVFVVLVEDLEDFEEMVSKLAPRLKETYRENHEIPPFLIFTSLPCVTDTESSEDGIMDDYELLRQCFLRNDLNPGMKVISVVEYLMRLKDKIYDQMCEKWKPKEAEPLKKKRKEEEAESEVRDPFEEAFLFLKGGILLR